MLLRLLEAGHGVAGVYAPPEGKRADPLADEAAIRGLPLFRQGRFRRQQDGDWVAIPEVLTAYRALGAGLNVLAYVTAILPEAPVEAPEGTAARPMTASPAQRSTSIVGKPRESRISRATTLLIFAVILPYTWPARRDLAHGALVVSPDRGYSRGTAARQGRGRDFSAGVAQPSVGQRRARHYGQTRFGRYADDRRDAKEPAVGQCRSRRP